MDKKLVLHFNDIKEGEHVHSHNCTFSDFKRSYTNNFIKTDIKKRRIFF